MPALVRARSVMPVPRRHPRPSAAAQPERSGPSWPRSSPASPSPIRKEGHHRHSPSAAPGRPSRDAAMLLPPVK